MANIQVAVAGRDVKVFDGYEKPSAGDVNTCSVAFAMTGLIANQPHKRVTFSSRSAVVTVDYADELQIPQECMRAAGALYLTVTGYNSEDVEVARTHRMTYPIEIAAAGDDEGTSPSAATLDVVSRVDALAETLAKSETARETAYTEHMTEWAEAVNSEVAKAATANTQAQAALETATTAADKATAATTAAEGAAKSANDASDVANTAATAANDAAKAANSSASAADTSASKADAATSKANASAAKADTAAANADTATSAAKSATSAAESATTAAKDATTKATASASACDTATAAAKSATSAADTATTKANAATSKAETAAANADTATAAAKTATDTATTAAGKADTATANATAAATNATTAATAANTAAALANSASQIYGVRFDGSASAGTRLGAAVGLVANPSTDTVKGENDFDSIYPWAGIRMVNGKMTDNGYVVTAVDGQEAFTTAEDTMVQIPLFWYKEEEIDGSTYTWVSPVRQAGWQPNPMCIRKDGTLAEYGYMAAFRINWSDGTYAGNSTTATPQSVAGAENAWNISLTDTIAAAKRKGANWTCTRIEDIQALRVLFEVEFANRNTQAIMQGNVNQTTVAATSAGEGQFITTNSLANFNVGMWVGLGTAMWNYGTSSRSVKIASIEDGVVTFEGFTGSIAPGTVMWNAPSPNGACLSVLGASGSPHSNTDGRHPCRYRYIEQPWGDSWEWISNLLINSVANGAQEPYYLSDPSLYTGSITDDYERLSYDMPTKEGYISHLGIDESKPFVRLTDALGGGSSNYYGDYYWKGDSAGTRAVLFGGYAYYGSPAGLSFFSVNSAPSNRNVNFRSRLSLAPA